MSTDTKDVAVAQELVTLTIDGNEVSVPKGTLIIRAAEMIGTAIPRFCDHPLLDPVGACRQCMVEIPDAGNGRGFPKPQASCTMPVAEGMVVKTQVTSEEADRAQKGILELLLINHPLDCPVCDKGGECPLQNQALSHGRGESRFGKAKRTFPKPVNVSAQILLDRERCVLCARCTRFSEQISGDPFISLVERGALQQVGIYEQDPYDSYFSGNVVQICPVGALTSASYRFQSRPFDLVSTMTTCEHCASGCSLRADHRHYQVKRRQAGTDGDVNEEWNCDKGRFAFKYGRGEDRLTHPLVRRDGELQPASWPEAIDAAVDGLLAAKKTGVLVGGRLTVENAYGYSRFARTVLGTNNIDYRARALSAEEADFLGALVAGREVGDLATFADLEQAKRVVCVSFEPEEEAPSVFLRLRKAVRKRGVEVLTIAPFTSRGAEKLSATLIAVKPGDEADAVQRLELGSDDVLLIGERAAALPGLLSALAAKIDASGAKFAWIPRRAGETGALAAGCLPNLLPGGRPLSDAKARVDVASAWGAATIDQTPGLDADQQLAAAAAGELDALVVAGVDPADLADPATALAGLAGVGFLVSIEQRRSAVVEHADVVFPAALIEEQSGHFLNWEQRARRVNLINRSARSFMSDLRILAALADAMDADLGFRTPKAAWDDLQELGPWDGARTAPPKQAATSAKSGVVLASWRQLLDAGNGCDNAAELRATAREAKLLTNPTTAQALGNPEVVSVRAGDRRAVLPLVVAPDMVDDVVWVPMNPSADDRLSVLPGTPVEVMPVRAGEGEE
ncbi:MAG: NADH-quinone oxidoreductase subunit G [Arachnia propionica]|nr:MAG: NADH-quinone oxidoreductase subunit G [Arachnia propionica]